MSDRRASANVGQNGVVGDRLKRRRDRKMEGSKMATQASQLIVSYPERYLAAWNQRDLAVVEKILTPSFSWIDPALESFGAGGT